MILRRAFRWAVAVLLAAGCVQAGVPGQDERASTRTPRAVGNTPAAVSPTAVVRPTSTAGKGTVEVLLGDHFVDPQVVTVKVGTTVIWRNSSGTHDVTALDGSFRSPTLVGDSFSYTFTRPGRYPYWCTIHTAEMRGEVVVEPAN
jgi:plastocyanin